MKKIFSGALLLLLCGCGPMTVDMLRTNPAGVYSFTIADDYHSVFQKTLDHVKDCYQGAVYGDDIQVKGDSDTEKGKARISIAHARVLDVEMLFAIDITRLEDNTSNVQVYYARTRLKPVAPLVEDWLKKDSNECLRSRVVLDCICFLQNPSF